MMINLDLVKDVEKTFGEKTKTTILIPDEIVECQLDPEVVADKYFPDNTAVNSLIKDFKYVEITLYGDDFISSDIQFYLDNDKGFWFDEILDGQLEDFYHEYEHTVDDVIDIIQYVEGLKDDENTESLNVFLFNLNCELTDLRRNFEEELEKDLKELAFAEEDDEE